MTNFEVALRTPLIIKAPWMKASVGRVTSVLAEAVDFYPTLAALAGLPDPVTEGEVRNNVVDNFAQSYIRLMSCSGSFTRFFYSFVL